MQSRWLSIGKMVFFLSLFSAPLLQAASAENFPGHLWAKHQHASPETSPEAFMPFAKRSAGNTNGRQDWKIPFSPKGAYGLALSMDVLGNKVAVAGTMLRMDDIAVDGIAIWNGTQWTALGPGLDIIDGFPRIEKVRLSEDLVLALSREGQLQLHGRPVNIVRWDGTTWSGWKLDSGTMAFDIIHWNNRILVATNTGLLEATDSGLVRLGNNLNGRLDQFIEKGTELWVQGRFTLRPDSISHDIVRWTGSEWDTPLPSMQIPDWNLGGILDFAWHGNELFVLAESAVFARVQTIMRWNGSNWSTIPLDTVSTQFQSIESGHELYLFGWRKEMGMLQRWDGNQFRTVSVFPNYDTQSPITDMKVDAYRLYISGLFSGIGSVRAEGVAAWNGDQWMPLSTTTNLGPAMCTYSFGLPPILESDGRKLYFGSGTLCFAGEKKTLGLASWDGVTIDDLGGGLKAPLHPFWNKSVNSIRFRDNKVFVGGRFDSAGSVETRGLAAWDGSHWSALGGGFPGEVVDMVFHGNELFIAGQPDTSPGPGSNPELIGQVMGRWNGNTWQRFGEGITGSVRRLRIFKGELHIFGNFTLAGDSVESLMAKWNDLAWIPVLRNSRDALYGNLWDAEIAQGMLFLLGSFGTTVSDGFELAQWDGETLSRIDTVRVKGSVEKSGIMISSQSKLFLAGSLNGFERGVVYWDGTRWNTAFTEPNIRIYSMGEFAGDLFIFGGIPEGDNQLASNLATWRIPLTNSTQIPPEVRKYSGHHLLFHENAFRAVTKGAGRQFDIRGRAIPLVQPTKRDVKNK